MLYKRILRKLRHGRVTPFPHGTKRALLSYTTYPFICSDSELQSHSNRFEARCIAELLHEHGYAVDVIDFENEAFVPQKRYDLCIDNGHQLERLSKLLPHDCIKIFHATTSHWLFQNTAEYQRLLALQKRNGYVLKPRRTLPFSRNVEIADYITLTGNDATAETYAYSKRNLVRIPVSTTHEFDFQEKDFSRIKSNFIWIGGSGNVHKGLDLVLDVFKKELQYRLDIFGKIDPDFKEVYRTELSDIPTITEHGFVDPGSKQFTDYTSQSIAIVFPSCSESTSTAVITALHAGLIPIVTREAGVDVGDFGILLPRADTQSIREALEQIQKMSTEELRARAYRAWSYARAHHTRATFRKTYEDFLNTIL